MQVFAGVKLGEVSDNAGQQRYYIRQSTQQHTSHALTTEPDVKRQGRGANLVAMTGDAPFLRMNSPVSSSDLPNPYTECSHRNPTLTHLF
jgi:bifunctional N-acetylglucosamine-1-phosphate-uridyltransferase/glucosamine-1-phosphate-acetyltransferase GlmU-like protein